MFTLAMRPRRGGHAVQVLGADIADRAAVGSACAEDQGNRQDAKNAKNKGERRESGERRRKARLAELAEQVRRICRRGAVDLPPCPSGLAELDEALRGGFARGAIHELIAVGEGAAARSIALLTAARAAGEHKSILFIDTAGDFYPPGAAQLGVPLERLVIVRPGSRMDALWACEQALRCTAVAAVITCLPRALETQISRRLQLAAEAGRNVGLLVYTQKAADSGQKAADFNRPYGTTGTRNGSVQTFAATRLSLEPLEKLRDGRRVDGRMDRRRADSRAGSCRAGVSGSDLIREEFGARFKTARHSENGAPITSGAPFISGMPFVSGAPFASSGVARPGSARWLRVRILKLREGQPVEPFVLEIPEPFELDIPEPNPMLGPSELSSSPECWERRSDLAAEHPEHNSRWWAQAV